MMFNVTENHCSPI